MSLLLLSLGALVIFAGFAFGPAVRPVPVLLDVDGMPDDLDETEPADGSTIDQWDRPDRAPSVRARRPRRPEGDL